MQNGLRARAVQLAAILFCTTAIVACQPESAENVGSDNVDTGTPPVPALPTAEPPIDRARLLISVARAASAHAAGELNLEDQRKLGGKQFEIRLRFGCDGQGPGKGDHGWSLDPDGRTLRMRAVPTLSLSDALVRSVAGENVEAVEGFWLQRPWMLVAACPAVARPPESEEPESGDAARDKAKATGSGPDPETGKAPPAAVQRIGIAQFFTPQDSRAGRRIDRPFEAVKKLKEREVVGEGGFNIVLSGRLRAGPDGRVILCSGAGSDRAPDCIISADVDRVRIERPDSKEIMAEWSV